MGGPDKSRRNQRLPPLAAWSLGVGIVATVGANLAHGLGHGSIGALVSAWPALALVGSFELLMMLIRSTHHASTEHVAHTVGHELAPQAEHDAPSMAPDVPTLEHAVRDRYNAGHSQRAIARDLKIDRRKVKRIVEQRAEQKSGDDRGHPNVLRGHAHVARLCQAPRSPVEGTRCLWVPSAQPASWRASQARASSSSLMELTSQRR